MLGRPQCFSKCVRAKGAASAMNNTVATAATCTHTHSHTGTYTQAHVYKRIHTNTNIHTQMHKCICRHTHAHTHTDRQIHTHTHTQDLFICDNEDDATEYSSCSSVQTLRAPDTVHPFCSVKSAGKKHKHCIYVHPDRR